MTHQIYVCKYKRKLVDSFRAIKQVGHIPGYLSKLSRALLRPITFLETAVCSYAFLSFTLYAVAHFYTFVSDNLSRNTYMQLRIFTPFTSQGSLRAGSPRDWGWRLIERLVTREKHNSTKRHSVNVFQKLCRA